MKFDFDFLNENGMIEQKESGLYVVENKFVVPQEQANEFGFTTPVFQSR